MCSPNLIAILQWAKLEKNSTKNIAECLAKLRSTSQKLLINGNSKASTICIFLLMHTFHRMMPMTQSADDSLKIIFLFTFFDFHMLHVINISKAEVQ